MHDMLCTAPDACQCIPCEKTGKERVDMFVDVKRLYRIASIGEWRMKIDRICTANPLLAW